MITDSLAQTCEMTQGTAARPARAVRVKGARTTHLNTTFAKESSKNLLYQFRSFGNRKSAIAPPLRLMAGVLWSASHATPAGSPPAARYRAASASTVAAYLC